jgi:hypothetical protein
MAKSAATRTGSQSKTHLIWTIAIYIFLAGALGTYFLPFVGVKVPVLGEKSWSVRSIVKTIPKMSSSEAKEKGKFSPQFDFMDFVKEVAPRGEGSKVERERLTLIVLGALVPIALVVTYLATVLGFFLAPLKKSTFFSLTSGLATVCASYVFMGVQYVNSAAHQAFDQAIADAEQSPFFLVTKHLVQEVTIEPYYGLFALLVLTPLVFLANMARLSRLGAGSGIFGKK